MRIALAYHTGDINQAIKLLKWVGFLCEGKTLPPILLVASANAFQLERTNYLCDIAAKVFSGVNLIDAGNIKESGWPGAPNRMFKIALEFSERNQDEALLWLEADSIPLCRDWYSDMLEETRKAWAAGKRFVGLHVLSTRPHMSGVGVYPGNWRSYAPRLATANDEEPWDSWAADEIHPHAYYTNLIQHVWKAQDIRPWQLNGNAVIFHGDKRQRLIECLDEERFGAQCRDHALFSYRNSVEERKMAMNYYKADNTNRAVIYQGIRVVFNSYEVGPGGSWRGVYATENESEIVALNAAAADPSFPVKVITDEEYQRCLEKKTSGPLQNNSRFTPVKSSVTRDAVAVVPSIKPIEAKVAQPIIQNIREALKLTAVAPEQKALRATMERNAPQPLPMPNAMTAKTFLEARGAPLPPSPAPVAEVSVPSPAPPPFKRGPGRPRKSV